MKIESLVQDIYQLIQRRDGWFDERAANGLGGAVADRLFGQLGQDTERRPTLRLSQMGRRCPRALWYSINKPELREALPPWAEIKYSFGHIIEALALALAKAAGHEVTGEQDELVLDGIVGHRDCVIDGCIVDVKSSSTRGMESYRVPGKLEQHDNFGYLDQLDAYVLASIDDPLVRVKNKGYILAIDKTLGHIVLYEHEVTDVRQDTLRKRIVQYRSVINQSSPPPCECGTVAQGSSGNIQLDTKASYSAFKHCCFPSLRTFLYSKGPVYLSHVERKPEVVEIDREGKFVYNGYT